MSLRRVVVQLDYYLGGQFAGLVTGIGDGLFARRGLDVRLVAPTAAPGAEGAAVVARQAAAADDAIVVGICEQNSLVAPEPVTAFGAMFDRSPLALARCRARHFSRVAATPRPRRGRSASSRVASCVPLERDGSRQVGTGRGDAAG